MSSAAREAGASLPWLSRRGAWLVVVLGLVLLGGLSGALRGAQIPSGHGVAPVDSDSSQAQARLDRFPGHELSHLVVVITRQDGGELDDGDYDRAKEVIFGLPKPPGADLTPVLRSQDRKAALTSVSVKLPPSDTPTSAADTAAAVTQFRDRVRSSAATVTAGHPALDMRVTGGAAFGTDITKSFDGANVRLLLVTLGVVALLLLATYRSPVLWLFPLIVVGLADQLAAAVTARVGAAAGLSFDSGIVSVLVFGAGTNYALLLISRYREELRRYADHRVALSQAWRGTWPAIVASNVTVVVALLTLLLASLPGTRGLGAATAIGLVIAVVSVLVVLPALLAVLGRWVFWPLVPRVATDEGTGEATDEGTAYGQGGRLGLLERLGRHVAGRPAAWVGAVLALLVVLAGGLVGTSVGLQQLDRFRTASEAADASRIIDAHFPSSDTQSLSVIADHDHLDAVAAAAKQAAHVTSAVPVTSQRATDDQGRTDGRISVVIEAGAGSPEAREAVASIRDAVARVPGGRAQVTGQEAVDADSYAATWHDFRLLAPLVLLVAAVVLAVLLRSLVAPVVLLAVNALSALATIGAGAWLGRTLLGWPALDLQVPLLAFLFLVALGIDYTIFLVHRARHEADRHGTREGMVRALAATGGVITSAGIVLAAVFAALGVLPLVTLGQLGLIVGLGVLLDTLLVRSVLVPGLAALLGDRLWWPSRPARG